MAIRLLPPPVPPRPEHERFWFRYKKQLQEDRIFLAANTAFATITFCVVILSPAIYRDIFPEPKPAPVIAPPPAVQAAPPAPVAPPAQQPAVKHVQPAKTVEEIRIESCHQWAIDNTGILNLALPPMPLPDCAIKISIRYGSVTFVFRDGREQTLPQGGVAHVHTWKVEARTPEKHAVSFYPSSRDTYIIVTPNE